MLQNRDLDVMREVADRGFPETQAERKDQLGAYPALECEKKIFELVTHLWEQRN